MTDKQQEPLPEFVYIRYYLGTYRATHKKSIAGNWDKPVGKYYRHQPKIKLADAFAEFNSAVENWRKLQAAIPNATAEMAIEAMTTGKHFFVPRDSSYTEDICNYCEIFYVEGNHFKNHDGTPMKAKLS